MRTVIPAFKDSPEVVVDPEEGRPVAPQPAYRGGLVQPLGWDTAEANVGGGDGGEQPTEHPTPYCPAESSPLAPFFTGERGAREPVMPPDPVRTGEGRADVFGDQGGPPRGGRP